MESFHGRQGTPSSLLASSPPRRGISSSAPSFAFRVLALAFLVGTAAAAFKNDFSAYPQGSQACLTSSADSSACTGNNGTEMNQCLCRNQGNFVYNTATCVAKDSPGDLSSVYATLVNNCQGTGVTIAVSRDAFMAAAAAATAGGSSTLAPTSTATSASSTGTSTPSPSQGGGSSSSSGSTSGTSSSDSLSTGTKIGIGIGVSFGAIACGLLAWFIYAYSRRRRADGAEAGVGTGANSPSSPASGTPAMPPPSTSELDDNTNRYWPHAHHPLHAPASTTFSPSTPVSSEWGGPAGAYENGHSGSSHGKPPMEPAELGTGPWNLAPTNQPLLAELGTDTALHGSGGNGGGHNYHDYAHADGGAGMGTYSPSAATHGNHSYVSPQTATSSMAHDENGTWGTYSSYDSSHHNQGPPPRY